MRRNDRPKSSAAAEPPPAPAKYIQCGDCGVSVERRTLLSPMAESVYHCEGSRVAVGCYLHEPHHATIRWPVCWNCLSPMGCWLCMPGRTQFDPHGAIVRANDGLWCQKCMVAANLETLLEHGVPAGFTMDSGSRQLVFSKTREPVPNLGAYPADWRQRYYQSCTARGIECDAPAEGEFNAFRKAVAAFRVNPLSLPSRRKLRQEQNRQKREFLATQIAALPQGQQEHLARILDGKVPA